MFRNISNTAEHRSARFAAAMTGMYILHRPTWLAVAKLFNYLRQARFIVELWTAKTISIFRLVYPKWSTGSHFGFYFNVFV